MGNEESSSIKRQSQSNSVPQPISRSFQQQASSSRSTPYQDIKYDDDEKIEVKQKETKTENKTSEFNIQEIFDISLKLRKRIVQSSSFVDQTLPLLTTVRVSKPPNFEKSPIDLVCVLDRSGSMSGTKIRLLKNTFTNLMEFLDENDRLSIISFSNDASRDTHLMRMNSENKEKTLKSIQAIEAGGGTNIAAGMNLAFNTIKYRRTPNVITGIFLLGDGLDRGAQDRVKDLLVKSDIKDNFTIHTFGFGNDHDPQLMTDIANQKEGNFYFIDDLKTVDEAFANCLGALATVFAKEGEITISPLTPSFMSTSVQITKAMGDPVIWTKIGDSYKYKMSQIIAEKSTNLVVELKIPKNSVELSDEKKSIKIARARLEYKDLDGETYSKSADLEIIFLNDSEEIKENEDDKDVMLQYYRVKGSELLFEAKKLAEQNNHQEAQKLLKNFKEELNGCSVKDEAYIRNMISDFDRALIDIEPYNFEQFGKHNLLGNARAQGQERFYNQSSNRYGGSGQERYETKMKSMNKKW